MSTRIPLAGLAVLGGLSAAGGFLAAADGSANARTPAMVRLAGSASALTRKSGHSTKAQASQKLTLAVWMADHAQAAQRFLTAVSTPSSSRYRHFLSPAAYTRRFSASPRQVRAVRSFLISRGFTDVRTSVNGDYVSATGSVARINAAFSVQMRRYETGGATNRSGTIETNDRALSVPAALRPDILAVTGLDSARPRAATASPRSSISSSTCSHYWAQRTTTFSPAYDGLTEAANAPCGYSAQQIRGAYGLTAADTGAGTRIALIQVGSPSHMLRTLTDYARTNGLPAPRPGQYREDHITQGPHRGRCLDGALEEAALDSEAAYAIAPRAEQLMVDGNDCDAASFADQALFEAALAPITGHRSRPEVDIESISCGRRSTSNRSPTA